TSTGFKLLASHRYLQLLAALVLLTAALSTLADFALKASAKATLDDQQSLLRFFALFYMGTSVAAFLLQSLLSRRTLRRLGLAGTVALLPGAALFAGVFSAAFTRLWTVTMLKASETVLANSLFRSGYELLYTPLPPEEKRPTKTIIDVA